MVRVLLRSLFALVVAAAAVLVGWRVLAPAEVLATVASPVPSPGHSTPGVTGQTGPAPLIVDGRIRVYAAKRQLRADAPVDAKTVRTAIWSLRRWPSQLSEVVASGSTVVSRWSDGLLVALDGITGKIIWRVSSTAASGYSGYRTGAGTVWAPRDLRVSGDSVLVTAGGRLDAYAVSTGTLRWTVAAACPASFTTTGGQLVCPSAAYDAGTGARVAGFPAGPYGPVGCDVASSSCAGLRDGSGHGWLTTGPTPIRAAALDHPGSTVAAGLVFYSDGTALRAIDPATGKEVRDYPAGTLVLGGLRGASPASGAPGSLVAPSPSRAAGAPGQLRTSPAVSAREGVGTLRASPVSGAPEGLVPPSPSPAASAPDGLAPPVSAGSRAATGRVVLLTADRRLLVVEPRAGTTVADFPLAYGTEKRDWDPGRWQVTDGFVAIERLATDRPDNPDTPGYYFSADPVIIAAL